MDYKNYFDNKVVLALGAVEQLDFVLQTVRDRGWSGADSFNYSPGLDPQEEVNFCFEIH